MPISTIRNDRTQANPELTVDTAVDRKTERPPRGPSFGSIMGTAADVALSGVEIGATVVGGPLVGAAVRGAHTAVIGQLTSAPSGPLGGGVGFAANGAPGVPGSTGEIAAQSGSSEQSTMNEVRDMQAQSQSFNLQFLALQEEVQQENRKFTTVSNVLKAKHETAKGAIGNIRS